MQPTPQPHAQPKKLDELLANVEHHVNYAMRQFGHITPALFFIGSDGQGIFAPESMADDSEKDDFATMARLACIAHGASCCVMVLEAWAKFGQPDEKLDLSEPPSEALDRKEYVILMGESRNGNRQRFLPIIRSGNGKFFGFGDSNEPGVDMQGRFAGILTPKVPDTRARALAAAMLQIKISGRGNLKSPRLPKSRR
jgi:hypothetical protein